MHALPPHEILDLDRRHVWHPYAPLPWSHPPLVVESAAGVRLRLTDGDGASYDVVDGMSSWWAAIHGYRNPALDAAILDQLGRVSHVMFGGLTHEPAVRLAARLAELAPGALEHVFFCDSGSVSVEVAVKMCLQHWRSLGRPEKRRLLTWRHGYHGDTFQPMSVCDPDGGMHSLWRGVLPEQVFVPAPPPGFGAGVDASYVEELRTVVAAHSDELAAIIVEPVVQGAGAMQFHDAGYLSVLRQLADEHDVLLVFDEIATGFGRTGRMFAAEHAGVTPDVLCVGKALTGGYLSMAATLCTPRVAEAIASGDVPVLMHGPTFMGNPLAAAVANASLDLLLAMDLPRDINELEQRLSAGLTPLRQCAGVVDVRVLGGIGVVQLDQPVDIPAATRAALGEGVWLRPFRDLIYTMPPYVVTAGEIERIAVAIGAAVAAV